MPPADTIAPMRRSAAVKGLLVLALASAVAPRAAAGAVRAVSPAAPGEMVMGYSAAGSHHLALLASVAQGTRLMLSSDGGRSFATVALPADVGFVHDATIEADGTRWLAAVRSPVGGPSSTALTSTAPDGRETLVASLPRATALHGPVTAHDTRYVALTTSALGVKRLELRRVTAAGLDPAAIDLGPATCDPELFGDSRGLWVSCGDRTWLLGTDGNAHPAIHTPQLELLGPGFHLHADRLYREASAEIWHDVPELSGTIRHLQAVPDGVFATMRDGSRVMIEGGLADHATRGPLEPDSAQLIATANEIRAQQGLPTLIGDPLISVASRDHARYQLRWRVAPTHHQDITRAGATGTDPWDRCAAVGTSCNSEIVNTHRRDPADAVWNWWTTPFHRNIVGTPTQLAAGGAMAVDASGAVAVMNGAVSNVVAVAPIGLPRGIWTGPVEFFGERPDPGAPCGLKVPYGVAQTAYEYLDPQTGLRWEPGQIALTDLSTGKPVPGCSPEGRAYNVPAAPLAVGRSYRASTTYTASGAAPREFSWTFQIAASPHNAGSRSTAPSQSAPCLRLTAAARPRARTLRKGLRVKVRSCRSGRARLELRSARKRLATRSLTLRANRTVTVRFKARARPGASTLRVVFGSDRASRTLRVRR
jgi:uncharacterized protein YkwD